MSVCLAHRTVTHSTRNRKKGMRLIMSRIALLILAPRQVRDGLERLKRSTGSQAGCAASQRGARVASACYFGTAKILAVPKLVWAFSILLAQNVTNMHNLHKNPARNDITPLVLWLHPSTVLDAFDVIPFDDIKGNWKKLGSGSFGNVYRGM
ncbi:hypothetical protein BKA82DRAFT_8685 [Pisolithus tinctorius]|uniref:Protein kinase domain-containing protein n=1 Tax=Pisolithus tinctorius Marx 270 TaxID=870435 RepID=A0A0C3JBT4_PISTI|nr:hypothetical protein BKA82DRAFT_8685 [Pisolithus tinctorius]KIO06553.1 hypothetical protein M404DRAFT_8685 [Pisolithus tinctorius Marx 270]